MVGIVLGGQLLLDIFVFYINILLLFGDRGTLRVNLNVLIVELVVAVKILEFVIIDLDGVLLLT